MFLRVSSSDILFMSALASISLAPDIAQADAGPPPPEPVSISNPAAAEAYATLKREGAICSSITAALGKKIAILVCGG
jgi:hypothetical protein